MLSPIRVVPPLKPPCFPMFFPNGRVSQSAKAFGSQRTRDQARGAPGHHHLRLPTSWAIRRPCSPVYLVDLDHHQLRKVDFPARTFEVEANPALPGLPVASLSNENPNRRDWMVTLGIVAVFIVVLAGFALWIKRRRPEWWRSIRFWNPVHLAPLNPR